MNYRWSPPLQNEQKNFNLQFDCTSFGLASYANGTGDRTGTTRLWYLPNRMQCHLGSMLCSCRCNGWHCDINPCHTSRHISLQRGTGHVHDSMCCCCIDTNNLKFKWIWLTMYQLKGFFNFSVFGFNPYIVVNNQCTISNKTISHL